VERKSPCSTASGPKPWVRATCTSRMDIFMRLHRSGVLLLFIWVRFRPTNLSNHFLIYHHRAPDHNGLSVGCWTSKESRTNGGFQNGYHEFFLKSLWRLSGLEPRWRSVWWVWLNLINCYSGWQWVRVRGIHGERWVYSLRKHSEACLQRHWHGASSSHHSEGTTKGDHRPPQLSLIAYLDARSHSFCCA